MTKEIARTKVKSSVRAFKEVPTAESTMRAKFTREAEASQTESGKVGVKKGQCLPQ